MADEDVREARVRANALRDSLPQSVDAAALGVMERAPFQLLCTREALMWRTEELARTACDALERDNFTAAALLVRAMVESAALAWKLMEVLDDRRKMSPQELNDILMRMLAGSRAWSDGPQALQILSCIDRMDKMVPGVRKGYDLLSEIAHSTGAACSACIPRLIGKSSRCILAEVYVRPGIPRTQWSTLCSVLSTCSSLPTTEYPTRCRSFRLS